MESRTPSSEATVAIHGSATSGRGGEAKDVAPLVEVGARIGRYIVLEQIGRGGMGVVVRAYDFKLRREVALKLVRPRGGAGDPKTRALLLREAQSLARLSDPHIVAVYDAELTDDGVYIAMEYVEGGSLRAWMQKGERAWREVLPVLQGAARGLAAAHAAGIVHRDIKPDNVLVSDDGRVRLTDFGLARERADSPSAGGPGGSDDDLEPGDIETRAGTVMGTPAYMAPEQHTGERTDDRGDQYALCVMCWEALHGARPFHAHDLAALYEAKRHGPPERPASRVPEWLHAAIARGLAVDPAARWPSVQALHDAMGEGSARARRRRVVFGLATVACVGLAGLGWQRWDRTARVAACERAGESIREVWSEDAKGTMRAALVSTGSSQAEETAEKVAPWLDAQAESWRAAQTEACLDANVRGAWSRDVLERATWCLDERRLELQALVTELSRGEPESVGKAVQAAAGLHDVKPCRDPDVLARMSSPPTEQRDEVRSIKAELSGAIAATRMGTYPAALLAARQALASAETLGWAPLVAQTHLALGDVLARTAEHDAAQAELEAAFFGAVKAGEPILAATAAEELVYLVGYQRARHEDGMRWSRHAEALMHGQPDPGSLRLARHLDNQAGISWATGDYDEALALNVRAMELREAALGSEHPGIASSLNNLANAHAGRGAFDEARPLYERAIAIWEKALGPGHPNVAASLANLGGIEQQRGAYDDAKRFAARALAIREAALGPDHPDVADSLNNLAGIALSTGDLKEAKAAFARSVQVSERALGADHPTVARGLYNLANVHDKLEEYEQAKNLGERALAIRLEHLGPDHPEVAQSLNVLGNVYASLGDHTRARETFERALAIWEKALGPDHPTLAYALAGLVELALSAKKPHDAVTHAERALRVRENGDVPPDEVARSRMLLARALWAEGRDRDRARELAMRVREHYEGGGPGRAHELEEVTEWLEAHASPGRTVVP